MVKLVPGADEVLRLAARCQHLERFLVPRTTFPLGKAGYLKWRQSLYKRQAERCREILLSVGFSAEEAARAAKWVAKDGLKTDPGTQALEDAACLVFLENEISDFAAHHADYPREKFIDILRKTWRKMSEPAHAAALALPLSPEIAGLVQAALAGPNSE